MNYLLETSGEVRFVLTGDIVNVEVFFVNVSGKDFRVLIALFADSDG